jgi:hypothetical protein
MAEAIAPAKAGASIGKLERTKNCQSSRLSAPLTSENTRFPSENTPFSEVFLKMFAAESKA